MRHLNVSLQNATRTLEKFPFFSFVEKKLNEKFIMGKKATSRFYKTDNEKYYSTEEQRKIFYVHF